MHALLLTLALACSPDADRKDDTGEPGDTGWDPRFDALVAAAQADLAASHALGVSVAVMEHGEVTFARAFGTARAGEEVPPTPSTLFQIGSTTKMQTAAGLLRLVAEGRVALDDTLADLLPELHFDLDPSWADQVTVHDLLSHQGAFYDTIPWDGPFDDSELQDWTYAVFDDNYFLMNEPGRFWNYSNPNFVMAGLITETLDTGGRMWPDIMRDDVYRPLGMDRTVLRKREVEADGDWSDSYGYGLDALASARPTYDVLTLDDIPDPGWGRPAGLAWSTPSEMLEFARFLMEGNTEVLPDDLRQALTAEQVNTLYQGDESWYGYGVMVGRGFTVGDDYYRVPIWDHGGNTLSFTSGFYVLPEQDFAISILSSGYGDDFTGTAVAALTTLVEGLPAPGDPPGYTVDPAGLDAHVGTYLDTWNVGEVIIGREGDVLTVEMPLLDAYGYTVGRELVPVSTDIWYVSIDGAWYDLTFIPDEDDGPSRWIRNRIYVATREDDVRSRPALVPTRAQVHDALARGRVRSLAGPPPPRPR